MREIHSLLATLVLALATLPAAAAIVSEALTLRHGDTELGGEVYWDDAHSGPRPGVLVVHEWWGLNDYARERARQLAAQGYVAFAADMYGKGRVTDHPEDAGRWMSEITANVGTWRERATLALETLAARPQADPARLAAIGYCFGGATVMQLAYAGAELKGVASFHGPLPIGTPEELAALKAKVLVEHGAADPFIKPGHAARFKEVLGASGIDLRMHEHPGAKHGFTVPGADARGMDGVAYDAAADRASWAALQTFLAEIFAPAR